MRKETVTGSDGKVVFSSVYPVGDYSLPGPSDMSRIVVTCLSLLIAACPVPVGAQDSVAVRLPGEFDSCYPLELNDRTTPKEHLVCMFKGRVADQIKSVKQGGEPELAVQIRSGSGAPQYRLVRVEQRNAEGERDYVRLINRLEDGVRDFSDNYQFVRQYDFRLKIDSDAPPRDHNIYLFFQAKGQVDQRREVRLHVAPANNEKYVIASAATPQAPVIVAGQVSPVPLRIENKFPTYEITVTQIKIGSNPPGLVDRTVLTRKDVVASGESSQIDLDVHGKTPLSWLLTKFNFKPSLNVSITYEDGFRQNIRRLPDVPIEFTVDFKDEIKWGLAVFSVVLGSLIGTGLRTHALPTNSSELIKSLVLSGMIVILVLAGQLEVVARDKPIPLHNPLMTLIISFIVSLFDPQAVIDRLRAWFPIGKTSTAAGG